MTSILTYIKENHLAILTIIAIGAYAIISNLFSFGRSDELGQVREQLTAIELNLSTGLAGISEYERLAGERDESLRGFQDYLDGEITGLQESIESLRYSNLERGDRVIESGILIEDSLRLINKIRDNN
jgi:hypothetical protein